MTTSGTAIGALIGFGLLAGFPVTLALLPGEPDLQVSVPGPHPYLLREHAKQSIPTLALLPTPPPDGLHASPTTLFAPGLDLRTWQVTYSHRWEREVALPIVTGPLVKEGTELCGMTVTIGAGLFDTSAAGAGFQEMLARKIEEALPPEVPPPKECPTMRLPIVKPSRTSLRMGLGNGGVGVAVQVVLGDGTWIVAQFPLVVGERDGLPVLRLARDRLYVSWDGPMKTSLFQQAAACGYQFEGHPTVQAVCDIPLVDLVCDAFVRPVGSYIGLKEAEAKAPTEVTETIAGYIEKGLEDINLGFSDLRAPQHPVPGNPTASLRLRLQQQPDVSTKGITFRACVTTSIERKVDAGVRGSVKVPGSVPSTQKHSGDATVQIAADADTLNHLLYFLWQSGAMHDAGTSKGVVEAALEQAPDPDGRESLLTKLAFDFRGFDPGLPPTLTPSSSGDAVGFGLGDVKIGDWDGRRVVAHAIGTLRIDTVRDAIQLSASLNRIAANCTKTAGSGIALTPCVSDLMPSVRERLTHRALVVQMKGADVLAKLPNLSFGGGALKLSKLSVSMVTNPARLNIEVRARVAGPP